MRAKRPAGPAGRVVGAQVLPVFPRAIVVLALAAGAACGTTHGATAQTRFPVLEYRVVGNTVLPNLAIEEAVYNHLGPGRTAEDVERARAALEEAYTKAGYPTVSVELPQQRVTGGIVTLRVVERPVGRLRVVGAQYFLPSQVRREAPALAPGTVPNMNAVQRDIVALNRLPDRRVTPDLKPGVAPNTVDVDLEVQDRLPLHATLEFNNRRSANTSPTRVAGTVRYDNLWQRGDSVSASFQTAPQNTTDSTVFSGSYLHRLPGTSGASLLGSVVASNSNVGTVGGTSVLGRGTIFGLRGLLPLGTASGFSHTAVIGIDRKSFLQNITLGGTSSEYPITYFPVSAAWQGTISRERSTTQLGATVTAALSGIGSDLVQYQLVRAFSSPSWAHLRLDGSHLQRFDDDLQFWISVRSQLSPYALISNEQLPGGGLDSVRGYLEVEALGDYGVTGQMELRSPSYAHLLGPRVDELRAHLFVDGGVLALNQPLPQQTAQYGLMSTGAGARIRLFDRLNGQIEGAAVLRDGPLTSAGSVRALFRIWSEF